MVTVVGIFLILLRARDMAPGCWNSYEIRQQRCVLGRAEVTLKATTGTAVETSSPAASMRPMA
jgi:hypothetical protein